MAHKKGAGSTQNIHKTIGKRRGVKFFGGAEALPGNILVRQLGTVFHPGKNVYRGKDHTLHAAIRGFVAFFHKKTNNKKRTYISIIPPAA